MKITNYSDKKPPTSSDITDALKEQTRATLVCYEADESSRKIHHDLSAVVRSFKYLSKEVRKNLGSESPTDKRKAEVLEENEKFLVELKEMVERILPLD